jgi:hypothetical protein
VLVNGCAASMNFAGAKSVNVVADKVQVSQRRMVPFGVLLAAGTVGLGLGFAVPALGFAVPALGSPPRSARSPTSSAPWERMSECTTAVLAAQASSSCSPWLPRSPTSANSEDEAATARADAGKRADEAVGALHQVFLATPSRPAAPGTSARALIRVADELICASYHLDEKIEVPCRIVSRTH